jgi:hypothetical protein
MRMSDGFVDAHGLGDLGRRPFSLVYVEVEEDPTSRRILQRGDGSVDLGEWFITHAGSLSTANADGRAPDRFSYRDLLAAYTLIRELIQQDAVVQRAGM